MTDSRRASINLGKAIQKIRKSNALTLSAVSEKTGLAISTLSKIENNQSSPNFDMLARLAEGLGLDLITLLGDSFYTFAAGARTINRANQGIRYETPFGTYEALSSEIAMKALQPMVVHVPKGKDKPAATSSHGGEEFIYVLEGSILFSMDPYTPTALEQGDSIHFDSLMPHGFVALGDKDAWILSVCLFDKKLNQRSGAEIPDEPSRNNKESGKELP